MFNALLRAFRHAKLIRRYIEAADLETAWTEQNAADLAAFFQTDTGKLHKTRLQNRVFKAAVAATQNKSDQPYHCGVARGFALLVGAIQDDFLPALKAEEQPEETLTPQNNTSLESLLSY